MTVGEVEKTIFKVRRVMDEWDKVDMEHYPGQTKWLETHTRYAFVDPIIRALGWDTSDPKECHPEYYRSYGRSRRVDYAMFEEADSGDIGLWKAVPDIIIEAKAIDTSLDRHLAQLKGYVRASPEMTEGVAVLTNGEEWRLYRVEGRLHLKNVQCQKVNIRREDPQHVCEVLHSWLQNKRSQ